MGVGLRRAVAIEEEAARCTVGHLETLGILRMLYRRRVLSLAALWLQPAEQWAGPITWLPFSVNGCPIKTQIQLNWHNLQRRG